MKDARMPRITTLLTIFLCLTLLATCTTPATATEIRFFQRGYIEGGSAPATQLTDAAVEAFTANHPGIAVKIVGVPWGKEGDLKLRAALLARRKIDCFRLAHDQLPAFIPRKGQLLAPADPFMSDADRADFGQTALDAVTHRGKVMAWPLWSTAITLIANPDLLARAGIQLPDGRPWTWQEFLDTLERLDGLTTDDGRPIAPFNAASRPPLFEWAPLLMAHCGPLFVSGEHDEALPLAADLAGALTRVQALCNSQQVAASFGVDDGHAAQKGFIDGRTALLMSSPGVIRELVARKAPFTILPVPTGDFGQPITTGALGCIAVVDCGNPERVAAAHALARFLTSAEIADAVPGWYLAPPARRSVRSFYDNPAYAPLADILPTARYLTPPVSAGFMETTFIPHALNAVLDASSDPRQALDNLRAAAARRTLK